MIDPTATLSDPPTQKRLWLYAHTLTHRREAAEDLLQETNALAWASLKAGKYREREGASIQSWLLVLMRRTWLNQVRAEAIRQKYAASLPGPRHNTARQETYVAWREVERALTHLPYEGETLRLHIQGYSQEEISAMTGTSYNTVAVRVHRGRKKLTEMFL
jgi:RNA polymerase sigma-70 factor (ECF subfamily)